MTSEMLRLRVAFLRRCVKLSDKDHEEISGN
jgi:hypothetical protein